MKKVDAQQGRRILDRLVGYKLSPFLWRKVMPGLSAGRVQSVAVRLIVERERERDAFKARESWTLDALFEKASAAAGKGQFKAELSKVNGKKADLVSGPDAQKIMDELKGAAYQVSSIETKSKKRAPYAPFITSTLQQDAARKLGFTAKKTMMIAQQLYEGVELLTGERTGLITYMRTDSTNLAETAVARIREVIKERFGPEYLPAKPRSYVKKVKGAQEAHEAIRPTDVVRDLESLKSHLTPDQARLYELIYKRTMSCQMEDACINQTSVDITPLLGGKPTSHLFHATGSTVSFPGFLAVYEEGKDDDVEGEKDKDKEARLPKLTKDEDLRLVTLSPEQHFTQPPPRFTEATLVKALEEHGIGRPSTYAPIISTIQDRGYVRLDQKRFAPEDKGMVVNDLLVEHFPTIVDIGFTAAMEGDLDLVASGDKEWVPIIRAFYVPFDALLTQKSVDVDKRSVVDEKTDEVCDKCGKPMVIRLGRHGKFIACSGYPECRNTKPVPGAPGMTPAEEQKREEPCELCGAPMVMKQGRFGKFWGCSKYPECKNIQKLFKPQPTGVKCPGCGGDVVGKRTKHGKIFYGCANYPKCRYATWDRPVTT